MSIYDGSSEKIYRMSEEQFEFILNCIENEVQDFSAQLYGDRIKDAILEKTEIHG